MISRAVDLVGFVVCAGITGVWTLFDLERVYFFLMFVGLVLVIHGTSRPTTHKDDQRSIKRIKAIFYAQGLRNGAAQAGARAESRLRRKREDGQQLSEAG